MQSSIFDFASPNGGTTGCRDLSCNKGCGGAIRCSYCGNQHIEKNEKCRKCNQGNGCVNLPPSPTRDVAAASSTSAAAAISSSAATSSTQVVNHLKRSSSLTSRDGGNSDEDGSVFTDNEGNETDSDDGDNEDESDDEDALDEGDEDVYTLFTGQNGGTYATLSGGELPDSITHQNDSQPMPQRSMLTNDELLIQLLGGVDDEDEKEPSEPPINPSDTPEFRKELRRLNEAGAKFMPKASMCSYGCGCIAECLLDPEDKTPGPRRGQYTNSLCYQHGRALIADQGGTLIECPSECKCGRNRARADSPLCKECYLDMECIKKGCKRKRWSWNRGVCMYHDQLKPCTGSSENCNVTRDRPGRKLCKACSLSSPCTEEDCDKPRWKVGAMYCEEHYKAKGCSEKDCDKPRWKAGHAYCMDHDQNCDWCAKCGKEPRISKSKYCNGCTSLCRAPRCSARIKMTGLRMYCGRSWCNAGHLGPEPTKKCAFCKEMKKNAQFHSGDWKGDDAVRKCVKCKK